MSKRLFSYFIGLDLGQSQDYTALCVIEEPLWTGRRWESPAGMPPDTVRYFLKKYFDEGRPPNPQLAVRHLERFALGTPYTKIVERVNKLLDTPLLAGKRTVLLVDKTGVGAGVLDVFIQSGIHPNAITIHGGAEITLDTQHPGFKVPKRDLVGAVQVLLQNRRLKIAGGLAQAEALKKELLNFRMKIDPNTAHDSYSHWREGDHDDLVLATAMACWFREWWNAKLEVHYALKRVERERRLMEPVEEAYAKRREIRR
jgi:hypothetical protein